MQQVKKFTAILVIALFGFTIGTEIFASHSEFLSCDEAIELKVADNGVQNDALLQHSEAGDSTCADPCHLGQCHFGHCSVVFSSSSICCLSVEPVSVARFFSFQMINGPALEGLRRPPKLS